MAHNYINNNHAKQASCIWSIGSHRKVTDGHSDSRWQVVWWTYIRKLTKYFLSFYGFFVPFGTFWTYQTFLGKAPHNSKVQKGKKKSDLFVKSQKGRKSPYNPYSTIAIVTANKAKHNRCVAITTLVVVRFLHHRTAGLILMMLPWTPWTIPMVVVTTSTSCAQPSLDKRWVSSLHIGWVFYTVQSGWRWHKAWHSMLLSSVIITLPKWCMRFGIYVYMLIWPHAVMSVLQHMCSNMVDALVDRPTFRSLINEHFCGIMMAWWSDLR